MIFSLYFLLVNYVKLFNIFSEFIFLIIFFNYFCHKTDYFYYNIYYNELEVYNRTETETKNIRHYFILISLSLVSLCYFHDKYAKSKIYCIFAVKVVQYFSIEILTYLEFSFFLIITSLYHIPKLYTCIHVWKPCPMFVLFLLNEFVGNI